MLIQTVQCYALGALLIAPPSDANANEAVLNFIPAEAHAALVIPNLKTLSDQITACMEGMDRDNMLMGGRAIDQFKAVTGFNVGLNDTGSMGIALIRVAGASVPVFIVPITNADEFLQTNLKPAADDAYALPSGKTVHARALGTHVAISESKDALALVQPDQSVQTLEALAGERGSAVAAKGDLYVIIRKELISGSIAYVKARAEAQQADPPSIAHVPLTLAADVETAIVSLDFDPLGLIVRSFAKVKADSRAAKILGEVDATVQPPSMDLLPDKPFYLAASFNFDAFGDKESVVQLLREANVECGELLEKSNGVQFAACPSPAGVAGGLLNDAIAVLRTTEPDAAVDSLKQCLLNSAEHGAVKGEFKWTDQARVNETEKASLYELTRIETQPGILQQQIVERMLFGSGGVRGYVKQRDGSVIITFSQRAKTLTDALEVASGAEGQGSLAGPSALRAMRRWLPATRAMEAFISVGQLAQFADQAMGALMPQRGDASLPIDPALPPIAIGAGPAPGGAEHAVVIPSAVLAALFDQAMRQLPGAMEPAVEE